MGVPLILRPAVLPGLLLVLLLPDLVLVSAPEVTSVLDTLPVRTAQTRCMKGSPRVQIPG